MLQILCIGDPHFKKNNAHETENMEFQILKIINENKPDLVIVLGDILHDFETITSSVQCRAVNFLLKIKEKCKLYIIIGNHDRINNREYLTEIHPFYALKNWDNTLIADKTIYFEEKGYKFLLVPYVPNGSFLKAIEEFDYKNVDAIFAHQEFKGCKLGCNISTEGDEWDIYNPLVITGHIHEYQRPQYNIIYTGTPIQHNFSDGKKKTISIYEFNRHIENEIDELFFKNDKTSGCKIYIKENRIKIPQKTKRTLKIKCDQIQNIKLKENSFYKIKIKGTTQELNSSFNHTNIQLWKEKGHKVVRDVIIENYAKKDFKNNELKFEKILYNAIKDNDKLLSIHKKYFGINENNENKENNENNENNEK